MKHIVISFGQQQVALKYGRESKLLAYGAIVRDDYDEEILGEFDVRPRDYYLQIARLEPENKIETVVKGYLRSNGNARGPLIVVGKTDTSHGKYLVGKYGGEKSVRFVGGVYDFDKLNSLRHFSAAYFHGHSVGGTNPSLLEAMASGCFIVADDNVFNRSVLHDDALYFSSDADARTVVDRLEAETRAKRDIFVANNLNRIKADYSWEKLTDEHERYFLELLRR